MTNTLPDAPSFVLLDDNETWSEDAFIVVSPSYDNDDYDPENGDETDVMIFSKDIVSFLRQNWNAFCDHIEK